MEDTLKEVAHHQQLELCTNRAVYRQGRKLTAVKVYTAVSESNHLFVYGVPKINLRAELKSRFNKFGQILTFHIVPDHKVEIFTECYHIQYQRIQSARIAKRLIDNSSFYGGVLHVCYSPEYETIDETILKLQQREKDVLVRLNNYKFDDFPTDKKQISSDPNKIHENVDRLSKKRAACEEIKSIYEAEDPILSCRKKSKESLKRNQLKYTSQSNNFNGSSFEPSHSAKQSEGLIPSPLRQKLISKGILKEKFIGPQLPQTIVSNESIDRSI